MAGATGWGEQALWTMPLARLNGYYHAAMLARHGQVMRRPWADPAEQEWLDRLAAARRGEVSSAPMLECADWDP